jgi:hypothetical protein
MICLLGDCKVLQRPGIGEPPALCSGEPGAPRASGGSHSCWPLGEHSTLHLFGSGVGMTVLTAWRWRRYE